MNQAQQQQYANQQSQVMQQHNLGYNHSTALQIRLNTEPIIQAIHDFLRGSKINYRSCEQTGKILAEDVKFGKRLANNEGIQQILLKVTAICNPQVVQGYFNEEQYKSYIERAHKNLSLMLVNKRIKWEIQTDDISPICDFIMELLEPFISRLKDNSERESYNNTIKSVESNTQTQKGGGILNWWG